MIISGGGIHIPGGPLRSGGGAPVTPLTIFGGAASVLQWCRADLGVTIATGVSAWNDQSGNGNHYTQATGGLQPARTAADATLNNLPTIGFDGVDDSLASPLVLPQASVTPSCLLFIAKNRAAAASNIIMFSPAAALVVETFYVDPTGVAAISSNGTGAGPLAWTVNTWSRGRCDFSNSAGDIFKLGPLSASGTAGNAAPAGAGRGISAWPALPANIAVFEVVYLNRIPTAPEVASYDAYVTAITAGAAAV